MLPNDSRQSYCVVRDADGPCGNPIYPLLRAEDGPGGRPTKNILIKFEIWPKYVVLWFKMYSTNHNKILHTSRQCNCRDVCKISLWLVEQILNYSTPNFNRFSNSIEISLVGQAPGQQWDGWLGETCLASYLEKAY